MSIWHKKVSVKDLQYHIKETLAETIGIELTEITDDSLKCRMEVNNKTKQSMGILHGGASAALAETLGSIASNMIVDKEKYFCVGLDINASHLRPVKGGFIYAEAKPIHLGKKTHVWRIDILNEEGKLVCTSRLTMAVIDVANKTI
jgi:1,4-dihydroxy-2-naphthoyl-CoA hydrolase